MNKSPPNSPRARLQALRAIPEKDRTDAEWDEMNELEIMLAAENRHTSPGHGQGQGQGQGQRPKGGVPAAHKNPAAAPHGNGQQRKFHKRPRRRKGGGGAGGGGGGGPGPNT